MHSLPCPGHRWLSVPKSGFQVFELPRRSARFTRHPSGSFFIRVIRGSSPDFVSQTLGGRRNGPFLADAVCRLLLFVTSATCGTPA